MQFGDPKGTFGPNFGLGTTFEEAENIFLKYISVGGNFIDTANFYHFGQSEQWIAEIIKKNKIDRERLVIASKYTMPMVSGDPNAAGNHKKNLKRSVKDTLARLQTDYLDILYVHVWDWSVDIEDLMRNLNEVIQSGLVLHIAASDFPGWVVSAANSIAKQRGWNPFVAYQGKWNLIERDLEQEVFPMCRHFNLATVPWSVLAQGKLTKTLEENQQQGQRKANVTLSPKEIEVQQVVIAIAKEHNRNPGQVALNWAMHKTTSPLLGCRTLAQLEDNLKALEFTLTQEQIQKLDEVSKNLPAIIFPNNMIGTNTANSPVLMMINPDKYTIQN